MAETQIENESPDDVKDRAKNEEARGEPTKLLTQADIPGGPDIPATLLLLYAEHDGSKAHMVGSLETPRH